MKSILVTGGKGLIGKEICKKYISEGWDVYTWDNESNPYNDYSDNLGIDLWSDVSSLENVFKNYNFNIVSHQASFVSVGESQYKIQKYMDNNIGITSELLQAMIETNNFPEQLIFASSMGIYGNNLKTSYEFLHENSCKSPCSFYGISKLCQEEMIRVFAETYKVKSVALRYFSVYGNINPLNPLTGVISVSVNKFLNSDYVEINEDGLQTRDFIHVKDIADIHYDLYLGKEHNYFEEYNICSGESFTLKEIAEYIKNKLNSSKEINYNKLKRKGDIYYVKCFPRKIYDKYGWKSKVNLFSEIDNYINYVLDNKDKFIIGKDTCKESNQELIKRGLL